MKILCVIDSLESGGAQRQLVELAIGFKEKGHIISFLTYFHNPFYNSILEKVKINVTCIQESNYIKRLLKIRRYIRMGRYDAILSFLEAPSFICEISGFPFRTWRLVVGERNANPKISKSFKLKLYRLFHIFADHVVTNSCANLKIIQKINPFLRNSKHHVIYNAVDLNRWKPPDNYIPRKNGYLKLIIAADQRPQKNLYGFLEALSLLNEKEKTKLRVEWYGASVKNSQLEAYLIINRNKLNKMVSFFPATHEITEKIKEADVIGLFSYYEGLPNSICEGMACGKTVICSMISDMPIILSNDQNVLFDPLDINSIKKTISYILNLENDELIYLGNKNREYAQINFSKDYVVNKYLELLC